MPSQTLIDLQEPIQVPIWAATLDGFRAWVTSDAFPEQGNISFIDQHIIVDMSPEELETHNKMKMEVGSVVYRLSRELDLGTFYTDRTLVTNPAAELSTEPDGTFVTWESFQAGRVRAVPREGRPGEFIELEGSPDWVLEVVSRSSREKDTELLRQAYHRAGIPEYWIVDALGRSVDFQILWHRRSGYRRAPRHGGWAHSRVFDRSFRLRRQRDPLGFWQYTLQVKQSA